MRPPPIIRLLVSVLVVGHFFGILVAVTSYSSPNFPAPQLAVQASERLQPYLQATFLNNAYRFFAPNPGTPAVFWFRMQFDDRSVRWVELPGHPNAVIRAPYQRRLNLSVQLAQYLSPKPSSEGKQCLAPLGEILLQSCVRHVAASQSLGVRNIGVYCVLHRILVPEEVRAGWPPTDLRTYQPLFVGAYNSRGDRVDEFKPAAMQQSIAHVVTGIVALDALPRLRDRPAAEWDDVLVDLGLPEPVRVFLRQHPELLEHNSADPIRKRIDAILGSTAESGQ